MRKPKSPTEITTEESAEFLAHVKQVQRLHYTPRITQEKKSLPLPCTSATLNKSYDLLPLSDGTDNVAQSFKADGLQIKQWIALKQGKFHADDVLDLHGYTVEQARQAFISYIMHARRRQYRFLHIIHGKGLRSGGKPVLQQLVRSWLSQLPDLLAYCPASTNTGGNGATHVLLQRQSVAQ